MSATGDALRLKLKRAEEHFAHFKDRSLGPDRFIRSNKTVRPHYDRHRQRIAVTPHGFSEPQLEWGIILGDVLHQLRTALDHIIYDIATRRHATLKAKEERSLHFPIFESLQEFNADWRVSQPWRES